jgi:triosephosphate isomerase
MVNKIIAGNWKSNKTVAESTDWLREFSKGYQELEGQLVQNRITTVICAPYINLFPLADLQKELAIQLELGAQDLSPYPEGAYTGQISAGMLKGLVNWVIVGHSERRKYFKETDAELAQKVNSAKLNQLKVIYCVSDDSMPVPAQVDVVAYEPVWAIGTGKTDSPENAASVVERIKAKTGIARALYGGSVTGDNIASFFNTGIIDGALIGGASLKPEAFLALVRNSLLA